MEGIPAQSNLSEEIELELQRKVLFAKQHCLSLQERQDIDEKLKEATVIQKERELTDDEVEHHYSFRERLDLASIVVITIPEARRVMEMLGFTDEQLVQTLSHENAHANKAMEVGATFSGYNFALTRDSDGGILVQPSAITSIPDNWSKEKTIFFDSQIIKAPDEYGEKMSPGDKEELKIKYGEIVD